MRDNKLTGTAADIVQALEKAAGIFSNPWKIRRAGDQGGGARSDGLTPLRYPLKP